MGGRRDGRRLCRQHLGEWVLHGVLWQRHRLWGRCHLPPLSLSSGNYVALLSLAADMCPL